MLRVSSTGVLGKDAGKMSESQELCITFNERLQTKDWDELKYRIAHFMMECCQDYYKTVDLIWEKTAKELEKDDSIFKRYPFSEDNRHGCIQDFEYYGNSYQAAQALNDGMKRYFPNIDYCFECTENGGDAYYIEIYKVANGALSHDSIRVADEEDLYEEENSDEEEDE